jgi:hypothetical protein
LALTAGLRVDRKPQRKLSQPTRKFKLFILLGRQKVGQPSMENKY